MSTIAPLPDRPTRYDLTPMVDISSDESWEMWARRYMGLPAAAWAMLDQARDAGHDARLTYCVGLTDILVPTGMVDPRTGRVKRARRGAHTQSLCLRVQGLLWIGWDRPEGRDWSTVKGNLRIVETDAEGRETAYIRLCTHTQAKRLIKDPPADPE